MNRHARSIQLTARSRAVQCADCGRAVPEGDTNRMVVFSAPSSANAVIVDARPVAGAIEVGVWLEPEVRWFCASHGYTAAERRNRLIADLMTKREERRGGR